MLFLYTQYLDSITKMISLENLILFKDINISQYIIMRVCVIFRGQNVREETSTRRYVDALMCWENWKASIIEDLRKNGDSVDIVFITYDSPIINQILEIIKPVCMSCSPCISQQQNFTDVLQYIKTNEMQYDRFIILRCDVVYKNYITKWPKWDYKGFILVNRDVHYPTRRLYADIIFIIDNIVISKLPLIEHLIYYHGTIHNFGRALEAKNIEFALMYDGYYHMDNHPIHAIASINEMPSLDKPYVDDSTSIVDISQWN